MFYRSARHKNVSESFSLFVNSSAAELSIDNLRPGTKYVFRIRAKNEVGVGNELEHIVTTANLSKLKAFKQPDLITFCYLKLLFAVYVAFVCMNQSIFVAPFTQKGVIN